jgi:hypothetical protein
MPVKKAPVIPTRQIPMGDYLPYIWQDARGIHHIHLPKYLARLPALDSLAKCEAIVEHHAYVPGVDNTGGLPPTGAMSAAVRWEIKAACNARSYHFYLART